MTNSRFWVVSLLLPCLGAAAGTPAQPPEPPRTLPVQAELLPAKTVVLVGQPVVISAIIHNGTDAPVTLGDQDTAKPLKRPTSRAATTKPAPTPRDNDPYLFPQGLSVHQVFGARRKSGGGMRIKAVERDEELDEKSVIAEARPIGLTLQPQALVGRRLDLTKCFFGLGDAGVYQITWDPFPGQVEPAIVTITVEPEKMVVITTDYGQIRLRLFYEDAPRHVANFLELVEQGFYDGLSFNRVIPDLLIQGGDSKGDWSGLRPDGKRLRAEFNRHKHLPGSVSMACVPGDPNSGSAQFFISLVREPTWDRTSTVFGEVADKESLAVVRRISHVPASSIGMPREPVTIRRATAEVIYHQAKKPTTLR